MNKDRRMAAKIRRAEKGISAYAKKRGLGVLELQNWEGPQRSRAVMVREIILVVLLGVSTVLAVYNYRRYQSEHQLNDDIMHSEYFVVPIDEPAVSANAEADNGK